MQSDGDISAGAGYSESRLAVEDGDVPVPAWTCSACVILTLDYQWFFRLLQLLRLDGYKFLGFTNIDTLLT